LIGVKLLEAFGQQIMSCVAFAALFAASRGREALLAVAVLAFCTSNTLGAAATDRTQHYAHGRNCSDGAGDYLALIDAHRFVTRFAANTQDIFVWWPQGETLRGRDGCTLDLSSFGLSMASFGLQYLASPWSGMPDIDNLPASSFDLLYGGRKVAVLSHDQADVQRLMARYARAGKELTYGQTIIRTSRFAFNLYVLERTLGPLLFSVPLARMETTNGGSATAGPGGLRLVTAPPQWTYSLSGQVLQGQQPPDRPIVVRTRVRVLKGELGISVSAKNDISKLIEEIFVHSSDEFRTVDLDIPIASDAGSLIFRNSSPSGASRAIIESVEVYRPY
jgi:hypothetical protein